MSITVFVSATAGDVAVEWTCYGPALIGRLRQLIEVGYRFYPVEQIGQVGGEISPKRTDRDVGELVKAGLGRFVDLHGSWETKTADAVTAEDAARTNTVAIRGPSSRASGRATPRTV